MKARVLLILCTLLMSLGIQAQNAEFETAAEAVKNMKVGWNLWNTLDSHNNNVYDQANFQSNETGWGNPKTKPELMKMMRKAGFGVIRVPVTWFPYTDVNGNVDPRWMARVHEVVDYVIDQGMYCLLNVHHDTADYGGSWIKADETNYLHNHKRFENIWRQIAEEFKDYDEHLLFEGYNEMLDAKNQWGEPIWQSTEEEARLSYEALNKYAQSFVNSVRSTGGNNIFRNLVVNTYAANISDISIENLKIPEDVVDNHIAFQIHYYPQVFTKANEEITETIEKWKKAAHLKGAPIIVGEWGIGDVKGLLTSLGLRFQGVGFTMTSVVLIPSESSGEGSAEEIILWEGNHVFDNWESTIWIDGNKFANAKAGDIIRVYYKDKGTFFQPIYKHPDSWADWTDFQDQINIQETYFQAPITEAMMGDKSDFYSINRCFVEKAKANDIATINWAGPICGGLYRSLPAFENADYIDAIMKGYYGDEFKTKILTAADYNISYGELYFNGLYSSVVICDKVLSLNDYVGFRLEMTNSNEMNLQISGENGDQWVGINSNNETFYFDKNILGNKTSKISLMNQSSGSKYTIVKSFYLIKKDGTEDLMDRKQFHTGWASNVFLVNEDDDGIQMDSFHLQRKQFVHTVEYDYLWAELNLFSDDIPLKLKNYKGIRFELAEMPKDVHIKVYGDGGQKEEYLGISEASTTILFNTGIFSNEINRVTLQYTKDGKGEAKVVSAWLIRQDGTEEYSDLSTFHGCNITNVEKYVPEPPVTITANNLTMTYGDEVPPLTYASEGGTLKGMPKLTTTATKASPVGTYTIKVEQGTLVNPQVTYVDGTLTINKAPLTVGVKNETITEGDAIPMFTLAYSGFRNGDTEVNAFTKKPIAKTTATASSKPGTYPITVSGGETKNYELNYKSGTLTIEQSSGIEDVYADGYGNAVIFNLNGQRLSKTQKGFNIINGKKVIKK